MQLPRVLRNLVGLLQLRRQLGRPSNLLLTSTISLTPNIIAAISGSSKWDVFRTYLQELGHNDRINVLTHYLNTRTSLEGYKALAHLIKDSYFSTILTTNLDSSL